MNNFAGKFTKNKMKEKNFLSDVITFSALLISVHYFLSYYLIIQYLKDYNLEITSILSCEDVLFTTAPLSITTVLGIGVPFFIVIIFLSPILTWDEIWLGIKNMSKCSLIIMIIFVCAILSFLIWYLIAIAEPNVYILCFALIVSFIIYNINSSKRYIILFGIFLFAVLFIYNNLKKNNNLLYSNDIRLHLDNDSIVESNQKHRLVFWGTKYVVIQKDSTKSALLYPVSQIKRIEWINH